jgi:methyl-accepting chemotaxis protein
MKWYANLSISLKFTLFFGMGMAAFFAMVGLSQYGFHMVEEIDGEITVLTEIRKDTMASALIAVRYTIAVEDQVESAISLNRNKLKQLLASIDESRKTLTIDDERFVKSYRDINDGLVSILAVSPDSGEGLIQDSELLGDTTIAFNEQISRIENDLDDRKKNFLEIFNLWMFIVVIISVVMSVAMIVIINMFIVKPLRRIQKFADHIASGYLADDLGVKSRDEIGQMAESLSAMQKSLSNIVGEVYESSSSVRQTSIGISKDNTNLWRLTEEAATVIRQIVSNMSEVSDSIRQNAESANKANGLASDARQVAADGALAMTVIIGGMDNLDAGNKKISDITGVIDSISFQTNLLALNAAVEAARAGEHGRGFAVVASEVRTLAKRSTDAAREIKAIIQKSVADINDFSEKIDETAEALSGIVAAVNGVANAVEEIAVANGNASLNIDEINLSMGKMDEMTQQNMKAVTNAAEYSENLKQQAEILNELVSFFQFEADKTRSDVNSLLQDDSDPAGYLEVDTDTT